MFRRSNTAATLLRLGAAAALGTVGGSTLAEARARPVALTLPPVGLGLWKSSPGEVRAAVKEALRLGYTLLDGAAAYGNEREVGGALAEAVREGLVRREDVWLVSKLFNTHHVWRGDRSRPAAALERTLRDLGVESLDLYLMHWPVAIEQIDPKPHGGVRLADGTPNPRLGLEVEFVETWREMLSLKRLGKVAHLGVCNFTPAQLRALFEAFPDPRDHPEVVQVELHPYLAQPELVGACRERGIALMAYSPLGSGDSYSGSTFPARGNGPFECEHGGSTLLQNELVAAIAQRHHCTPAQVLIAWSVCSGFCCLPKSVQPERIAQNLAAKDIELSAQDMAELRGLDCGFRYGIGYLPGHYDCPNAPWWSGSR